MPSVLSGAQGSKDGWDGICQGKMVASYSHIHSASFRGFPSNFIRACKEDRTYLPEPRGPAGQEAGMARHARIGECCKSVASFSQIRRGK